MINSQLQIPTSSSLIHATSIGVAPLAVMNTATSSLPQNNSAAVKVKAVVTVKLTAGSVLSNLIGFTAPLDIITDLLGKTFLLELVSAELDPSKHNQYYLHAYKPYFHTTFFNTSYTCTLVSSMYKKLRTLKKLNVRITSLNCPKKKITYLNYYITYVYCIHLLFHFDIYYGNVF